MINCKLVAIFITWQLHFLKEKHLMKLYLIQLKPHHRIQRCLNKFGLYNTFVSNFVFGGLSAGDWWLVIYLEILK